RIDQHVYAFVPHQCANKAQAKRTPRWLSVPPGQARKAVARYAKPRLIDSKATEFGGRERRWRDEQINVLEDFAHARQSSGYVCFAHGDERHPLRGASTPCPELGKPLHCSSCK